MTHEDPNILWEWRLVGARWEKVATGYRDDWFIHDHPDPAEDPPTEDPPTLEEELDMLRSRVQELEELLNRSFLLLD